MDTIELLDLIGGGENSKVEFKREIDNDDSVTAEIIAMANSKGGHILLGIEDKSGEIKGLTNEQLHAYGSRLATMANEKAKPQVFIFTEVVTITDETEKKKVLIVEIPEGSAKPYKDKNGAIWVRQGADKRRVTDNNEQLRLFQQGGLISMDEMPVAGTSTYDVDERKVEEYMEKISKNHIEDEIKIDEILLSNLNVLVRNTLTLGGLLFFGKNPQKFRPAFCIKAVSFFGNSIGGTNYRSSRDITGTIPEMFDQGMDFFTSNLQHIQAGQNFNQPGRMEVSNTALEELLQNALMHRDYSKNAPVRLMIFDDRIEIVSPGSLPNSLTVDNIRMGNAAVRNNLIISYGSKLMVYRGFGSGVIRALEHQPDIEFYNEVDGEQFRVVIPRKTNVHNKMQ